MASTASERRNGPAKKVAKKAAKRAVKAPAKAAVKAPAKAVKSAVPTPSPGSIALKLAQLGARVARTATERAGQAGIDALLERRLPIQVGIDIAAPLQIVWDEWMTFDALTEGVNRLEEVERDGDEIRGTIAGPRARDWAADVVDERPQESFAWRSTEGSDCAGLATFHRLSDRLTRIELDLDVLPKRPGEALSLSTHLAHHRAETELRRFKARVEFINPDVYEDQLSHNGDSPNTGRED
jgi:uncharacterized membrane protein